MRHLSSGRVRAVLIIAVLLSAGLAILTNFTGQTPGELAVQYVLTPLRTGVSTLTEHIEQIYDYVFRYETMAAENDALRQQINKLQEDVRQADAIARENERLRKLLELKNTHQDYELVDGYIISRSSLDWQSTLTINRGTEDGIALGMCAITETGEVVGLVSEVGSNYAVVKTVLDSSLQISALLASSGTNGMIQGGYASEHQGLLKMDYLPTSTIIKNGDQVVTAGSTVYPRNLILGKVVDAGFNDTGVAKFALIRPSVDVLALEQIFVLTKFGQE